MIKNTSCNLGMRNLSDTYDVQSPRAQGILYSWKIWQGVGFDIYPTIIKPSTLICQKAYYWNLMEIYKIFYHIKFPLNYPAIWYIATYHYSRAWNRIKKCLDIGQHKIKFALIIISRNLYMIRVQIIQVNINNAWKLVDVQLLFYALYYIGIHG